MKLSRYNHIFKFNEKKYLFNTKSVSIIELDEELELNLLNSDLTKLSEDNTKTLIDNDFIIENEYSELDEIKKDYWDTVFNSDTLYLTIMTTLNCNFKCFYCFEHRVDSISSLDSELSLLNFVESELVKVKNLKIDWYGGEPLLNTKFIEELSNKLIKLCNDKEINYIASITTNGYLLSRKTAEKLNKLKVKTAQITIDGCKEFHDKRRVLLDGSPTYDIILDNIYNCRDLITSSIRCNIDKTNFESIKRMIDDLKTKRLADICIAFKGVVSSEENNVSNIELEDKILSNILFECNKYAFDNGFPLSVLALFELRRQIFCVVDTNKQFIITPELGIFKCGESYLDTDNGKIGNIYSKNEFEISEFKKSKWIKDPFSFEKCRNCLILPLCSGGCQMKKNKDLLPCNTDLLYNLDNYLNIYMEYLLNE